MNTILEDLHQQPLLPSRLPTTLQWVRIQTNQGDVAASTLARVDLKFSCKLQMKYSAQEMLSTMKMQPENCSFFPAFEQLRRHTYKQKYHQRSSSLNSHKSQSLLRRRDEDMLSIMKSRAVNRKDSFANQTSNQNCNGRSNKYNSASSCRKGTYILQ